MRAKAARVPFEDEKFSYLAAAHTDLELVTAGDRIIKPPKAMKAGIEFELCTNKGIAVQSVLKRDKPAYKSVAKKKWGDAL